MDSTIFIIHANGHNIFFINIIAIFITIINQLFV